MNRKHFLSAGVATASALLLQPYCALAANSGPEPYKPEVVKEFVGAGHGKLDVVKSMLAEYPNLLYARYDWGNGDFEEAIEGAGHVGNKEIAQYLISMGARPNLFVLAMLGETAIVTTMLERYPGLLHAKGAHGFTLLHHALRGGEVAREVLAFLEAKGLKEIQVKIK